MAFTTQYIAGVFPAEERPRFTGTASPELWGELRHLKEQTQWMERLLEDDPQSFAYGDDGGLMTGMHAQGPFAERKFEYPWAYAQAMSRPNYGACFYINWMQHHIIQVRSRAFTSINPHWHGVLRQLKRHVIAKGHSWRVVARDPSDKPDKKKRARIQRYLDDFYFGEGDFSDWGNYRQVQKEKLERMSRDGEFFLEKLSEDGVPRVRFIEPTCVGWAQNLDGVQSSEGTEILLGVEYRIGDYERSRAYHVAKMSYHGSLNFDPKNVTFQRYDAADVQHRKANVDRSTPRGIPDTYWVQTRLEQALRTLRAVGTMAQIRAKVALIRKRVDMVADAVGPLLSAQAMATYTRPGGLPTNVLGFPDGMVVDTSDNTTYEMPGQNVDIKGYVDGIRAELEVAAADMGLADYMLTGTAATGSFASAMVHEGPVVKTFEDHQQDVMDDDRPIIQFVLQKGIESGRIPDDTLEMTRVEVKPPSLAGRNAIQAAQASQIKLQSGVLSVQTWQQEEDLDPDVEEANQLARAEHEKKVADKSGILPAGAKPGQNGGTAVPRNRQTSNARPFAAQDKGRQKQRASGATREEEVQDDPSDEAA